MSDQIVVERLPVRVVEAPQVSAISLDLLIGSSPDLRFEAPDLIWIGAYVCYQIIEWEPPVFTVELRHDLRGER